MKKQTQWTPAILACLISSFALIALLFPLNALAQRTKPAPTGKKIHWYMDYSVTVKGNGRSGDDASTGRSIIWSVNRVYSGSLVFDDARPYVNAFEVQDRMRQVQGDEKQRLALAMKIMADARSKSARQIKYTNTESEKSALSPMHIKIDDKLEIVTDEECSDNSDETTTEIKIWKVDKTFNVIGNGAHLMTDDSSITYNVYIPIAFAGNDVLPMSSQTKYSRSHNVKASKKDTTVVETKTNVPEPPDVLGLIADNLVRHAVDRPYPMNFLTAWEYDSGNLTPDKPLIAGVPDSQTAVKIRVTYRLSKVPLY
jgi:hypothetical protein